MHIPVNQVKTSSLAPSPFLYQFDIDSDHVALFHSIDLDLLFMRRQSLASLSKTIHCGTNNIALLADSKNYDPIFRRKNIFVRNLASEWKKLFTLRESLLGRPRITMLYLLLTLDCNFRCNYCYLKNTTNGYMSHESAESAIDSFISTSGIEDRLLIIFYGGEPLLNFTVLKHSVEYATNVCQTYRKKEELIHFQLVTNGSLLNTEIVHFLSDHNIPVAVSLDGPQPINDQQRKYRNGRGSFQDTLRGIHLLRHNGVKFSISCTIGDHNLSRLPEVFLWLHRHLGTSEIGLNILQGKPLTPTNARLINKITESIIHCFTIARDLNIYEQRIMRTVSAFVNKEVYPFDCGGCGRQIVITPDGSYGPCPAFVSNSDYFRKLPIKDIERDALFIEWSKRSPLMMDACVRCEAIGICGGGCAYHAFTESGSIWDLDKRYCIYMKRLLKWLIRDTFYQIPGYRKGTG